MATNRPGFESSVPNLCNKMNVEDDEETDSSSSFDDSDYEQETNSEVVSYDFDGFLPLRTKKLTTEWKKFIKPVMWKCRWLELQIKKCNSQALKYDKELAAYNLKYDFESGNCSNIEGHSAKTLSFSSDKPRDKLMRRHKRIKIEDKSDIKPRVSNLCLFSCNEGKHNGTQEKMKGDEKDDDERSWVNDDVNDPIERVLRKIETLKSKVNDMKTQLSKVVITSKKGGKLSSNNNKGFLRPSNVRSSPTQSRLSPPIVKKPVVDEPEQPSNNEPSPKTRSLAQLFPPPRNRKRRGERRASSGRWCQ